MCKLYVSLSFCCLLPRQDTFSGTAPLTAGQICTHPTRTPAFSVLTVSLNLRFVTCCCNHACYCICFFSSPPPSVLLFSFRPISTFSAMLMFDHVTQFKHTLSSLHVFSTLFLSFQTSYLSMFRQVYTVGYATSLISLITAIVVFSAFR